MKFIRNAQWFEDNAPLDLAHKRQCCRCFLQTVNVAGEAGDASPSTPIGVNLPNNNWIRQQHGSKSVSLGNIIGAYNNAGGTGRLKEFAHDEEEIRLEENMVKFLINYIPLCMRLLGMLQGK